MFERLDQIGTVAHRMAPARLIFDRMRAKLRRSAIGTGGRLSRYALIAIASAYVIFEYAVYGMVGYRYLGNTSNDRPSTMPVT